MTRSLNSYFKVWDTIPAVFAEPNSRKDIRITDWFESSIRLGIEDNWRRAAEWCVGQGRKYSLLMEDDIEWHTKAPVDLRTFMQGSNIPSGFISPYCSSLNAPRQNGWACPSKVNNWCGCLALLFRTEQLKIILDHEITPPLDLGLGHVCRDLGLDILTHRPTLVKHIGTTSCNQKVNREVYLKGRLPCL